MRKPTYKTTVSVPSAARHGYTHPIGTVAVLVEPLDDGVWIVELRVPDKELVGGAWYDTVAMPIAAIV